MKILGSESHKGIGKFNNDIINHIGSMCYVIDGATALFDDNIFFKTSDLYEYMQLLHKNILDTDNIINNLKLGISKSNINLKNIDLYDESELPTYAIAAIKEYHNYYETYLLCDCLISILYKDGSIENMNDESFDKIKFECRNEIKDIDKMNLDIQEKLKIKKPIFRKYRKLANKGNGYPVGSTNENSIDKGILKKISKENLDKILICTDGFYNAIGIPNNSDYFIIEKLKKMLENSNHIDDLSYILISNE